MSEPETAGQLSNVLTILGQQPRFQKLYTQIAFFFARNDHVSDEHIINVLRDGLERLSKSFPWVAGQTVNENASEANTGIYKIVPLEQTPRLVVRDLRGEPSIPSMDDLERRNFPCSMLDESVFCPVKTYSMTDQAMGDEAPVLILQSTFVRGGLVLTVNGQHNTMDMAGQGQVMRLLAKACKGQHFTSDEISSGNLEGGAIIPLLHESYQPGPELDHQIIKHHRPVVSGMEKADGSTTTTTIATTSPSSMCEWASFVIPSAAVSKLKAVAGESLSSGFISTDDALCALVWKSVLRARSSRVTPATTCTFARAVDVRPYLAIPPTYPGLMAIVTYSQLSADQVMGQPLGQTASALRATVDVQTSNVKHLAQAYATLLTRSLDKAILSVSANLDLSVDLMLSSWAKVECCHLDFNLGLGVPLAVRRPRFSPTESLVYFMPRTRHDEIVVQMCLRKDETERLKGDDEFGQYATYID